jgi:hypothetical protein
MAATKRSEFKKRPIELWDLHEKWIQCTIDSRDEGMLSVFYW